MINVLVELCILIIVGGLVYWLVEQIPLPDPFKTILRVVVIIILILLLLNTVLSGPVLPHLGRWS